MKAQEQAKKYWENPEAFKKRNQEIYEAKEAGVETLTLCIKYGLTSSRIYKIWNDVKASKKFRGVK